jgi:ABC-type bacteriocin/lantibiotic exporter with double-glycine peptidase domain
MMTFGQEPPQASEDDDATLVLLPEQKQRLYRRRTALLSGLISLQQSSNVSPGLAEVIDHREQRHARQTRALSELVREERAREQAQRPQAPIRIQSPATPAVQVPEAPRPGVPEPAPPQAASTTRLSRWRQMLARLRPRRIPVLLQLSAVECGAACLAMLLSYYGHATTVADVRQRCQVGRDGLSALDLVKAARSYGLRVRAVSLQEDDLSLISVPAIVHWEFNHFLIVERVSAAWVQVVDPALGRRRLTTKEFFNGFTGITLMLEPGVQFERAASPRGVTLASYARTYLKLAPWSLVQILGASLLLQVFGLAVPLLTAVVVNQVIPFHLKDTLTILALGLLLLIVAQVVMTLLRSTILLALHTRVDTAMMLGFFEQLTSLPLRFFQQRSSGDLLARLGSNLVIRETLSNQVISTLLDGSLVVTYLLILFRGSLFFGIVALAVGVVQVGILLASNRLIRRLSKQELLTQGKFHGYAAEALVGITTLKAAGAEQRALERWTNLFFEQMNASVRRSYLSALVELAVTNLRALAPLLLLVIGTFQVLQGTLQAGTMLALVTLATYFLTPLGSLVTSGQHLQIVRAHLERVADVLDAEPEQAMQTTTPPPRLTGHLRLQNVSFQYDPHSPVILHDIHVAIRPGQKVALVGRTGSGKTTLGMLLLGLYLPTSGDIFYDHLPLYTLNYQSVRAQFGVVTQGATIFSGTIRENIALNQPAMPIEQVIQAAQAAAIHEDILRMPMEYETFVAEGGSALSGGQRQRLALARALASNPVILLLDEATSALDVVTEQAVERNLQTLNCTQIIIAHRLSTIRNADLILVLDQGTILERGTHEELLSQQGAYAQLIHSQLATGEIKAG